MISCLKFETCHF